MIVNSNTLCVNAMRLVGYLSAKEPAKAADVQVVFDELQRIMDSWKLERLLKQYDKTETVTVLPGQELFTVGPGGDCDIPEAPVDILAMWTHSPNGQDTPIAKCMDIEFFRSWRDETLSNTYPKYFYYQRYVPEASVFLYPKPSAGFDIQFARRVMPEPPAVLGEDMELQQGWNSALLYVLASNAAIPLNIPASEQLARLDAKAKEYVNRLKRANSAPTPRAPMDPSLLKGRYSTSGTRWGYNAGTDSYNGFN